MFASLGVPCEVRSPGVGETREPGEPAERYVERVVDAKLAAVRAGRLGDAEAVLVADTGVVAPGGAGLGKPESDDDARAMPTRPSAATPRGIPPFALPPAPRRPPVCPPGPRAP